MLPFGTLFAHSLWYGLVLSALLSALIIGTLAWRPMIWLDDAPAEVRAAVGPMSDQDRRAKRWTGVAFFVIIAGVCGAAMVALARLGGGAVTIIDAALSFFIIFLTFNLVDLILLDWLVVEAWRPGFIRFPGATQAMSFGGYAYHFRGFLIGIGFCFAGSLLFATIAVIIW